MKRAFGLLVMVVALTAGTLSIAGDAATPEQSCQLTCGPCPVPCCPAPCSE